VGEAAWQEEDAQRFTTYHSFVRDSSFTQGKVKVALAEVEHTPLGSLQYVGLIPQGRDRAGRWSDVIRVFQRQDGYPVFLEEWDYVGDGGSVTLTKEFINVRIHRNPGALAVAHSDDGRAISNLFWVTPRKVYTIKAWGDVLNPSGSSSAYDKKWLLDIAEGLGD
jgi:hypothetical protein